MKIVGNTVGMGLPKPNLRQDDPKKGDYVKNRDKINEIVNDALAQSNGGSKTVKQNNPIHVAEMIGVARSYYNARWKDKEKKIPTFIYNQENGVLSGQYNPNSAELAGAIDCSTYVGLVLRGIPFEKSPYAHLAAVDNGVAEDDFVGTDDNEPNDTPEMDAVLDPADLLANTKDYGWAINPFDWKNKLINNEFPVRTASQLAQWMSERGQAIPLDEKFTDVQRGDIIFWAKKKSNGDWVQPERFMHISHVAICANVMDAPTPEEDKKFPSGYPKKHTMLEVTTAKPYVLNRTLEKCSPDSVVMVCRPDLGALGGAEFTGNVNSLLGITDISNLFRDGLYYLTSAITGGLPDGISSGTYHTLRVEKTFTRSGKPYSIIQTLFNTKTNGAEYRRTQYCYSHAPNAEDWTPWKKLVSGADLIGYATEQYVQNYAQPKGEYLTEETDPTVPNWAKQPNKPSYTASEVGARPNTWMPTAKEVGALPSTYVPPDQTPEQVGADPAGTAEHTVGVHDASTTAHNDIRLLIEGLSNDKLDADKLPTAINTALAQAKESGEFDGADGVSPTVSVSKSGKVTTVSITDKNGTKTATINDGEDGGASVENYTGKKILFMGDSITRQSSPNSGWVGIFNTMLQPSSFVNTAVVGAGWVETDTTVYDGNPTQTSNNVIGNQIEKIARGKDTSNPNYAAVAEYAHFDIIIIAAGINDYSIKTDEPAIEDSFTSGSSVVELSALDRKVFASAFRYNVERIKKLYPTAQLFICTPTQVALGARTYKSVKEKRDHIIALCERMSVTYIDTFMCGIYSVNEVNGSGGLHLNDGVHPNDAGKAVIANYNAREVIKHYIGGNASVPEATYTNRVPTSIDADGTVFNGVGYQNYVRIGSSGTLSTSGAAETTATGFIKVSGGNVVRISGGGFNSSDAGNANAIGVYGKNGELPGSHLGTSSAGGTNNGIFGSGYSSYGISSVVEETTGVYKWIVPPTASGVEYIRISCWQNGDHVAPGANLIVTVNEEIV